MNRKVVLSVLILFSVMGLACQLTGTPAPATPDPAGEQTRVARAVAATLTAVPTATQPPPPATDTVPPPADTLTPVPLLPTPAPVLPTVEAPADAGIPPTYVVEEEIHFGQYTVRLWRNTAEDAWGYDNIATISANGQGLVEVGMVAQLGDLTGADITGEGHPDVIIETFTGGAHCCFSTIVYDLGSELIRVLQTPESNCGGQFEDIDGDSVFEFVTCDDLFAYTYCSYAASPAVMVILRYEPGLGYVPVSPDFVDLYADSLATHLRMAEQAQPGELGEWDETTKCAVLPLMLDYLYTGQGALAWDTFNRLYGYPDRLVFWAEVAQGIAASPLYAPAGAQPPAPLPSYYMLQLLTNCGPDWQYVGLLSEGQPACDPAVPQRDIYWLEMQLHSIGLLEQGEGLQLTPEGCTANCRLDVVQFENESRQGSVRLDTVVGFPGAVYRVNGVESPRWRLRGDLTWEQVSP
jgi:hypothetical protein